jgi:hypothetical protein
MVGIEPTASILSEWRSTTELHAQFLNIFFYFIKRKKTRKGFFLSSP